MDRSIGRREDCRQSRFRPCWLALAIGASVGQQLGLYVDNASGIADKVQTFLQESSDRRTLVRNVVVVF